MNDEVVGIAVLEGDFLNVVCYSAVNRWVAVETIRAYPRGLPKPAETAWAYWMENDRLNVTPSLHIRYEPTPGNWVTKFHNGGTWSVPYQRVDKDGWSYCCVLNADLITKLRNGTKSNR